MRYDPRATGRTFHQGHPRCAPELCPIGNGLFQPDMIGGDPIGHKGSLVTAETANIKLRNCALGFLNQPGPAQCKTWRISQHDHYFQHKYRFSTISITGSQGRTMGFYSYLKIYSNRYQNRNERDAWEGRDNNGTSTLSTASIKMEG